MHLKDVTNINQSRRVGEMENCFGGFSLEMNLSYEKKNRGF